MIPLESEREVNACPSNGQSLDMSTIFVHRE